MKPGVSRIKVMKPIFRAVAIVVLLMAGGPAAIAAPAVGDLHPSYIFAPTGETMTYRLYVPAGYDGQKPFPLVVLLHGAGGDENTVFNRDRDGAFKRLADQHGYILLAARGYKPFGGYGNIYPVVVTRETAAAGAGFGALAAASPTSAPARPSGPRPPPSSVAVPVDDYAEQSAAELTDAHIDQLSEQELVASIAEVRRAYTIDAARIYLTGNSAGGVGTAYIAAKYPDLWAAIAPGGGPVAAWSYPFERLRDHKIPALFVHGELDEHANPHWSEVLVDAAKMQGVDARFLLIKGGHHGDAWAQAMPQIFDFFDAHHR